MTLIHRPHMPQVMRRAFDAFRASDAISVGEAFLPHALMVAHIDPKLLALVGIPDPEKPVRMRGSLLISELFAHEFQTMHISYVELHSELRVGREMAATVDFEAKLQATGHTIAARCSGLYTLSKTGHKIESARTVCKLITPGWGFTFN